MGAGATAILHELPDPWHETASPEKEENCVSEKHENGHFHRHRSTPQSQKALGLNFYAL